MTDPETTAASDTTDRTRTTRRTFLVLSGSTVGVGLSATGAAGTTHSSNADVRVASSPPHKNVVDATAAAAGDRSDTARLTVRTDPTTAGAKRFTHGAIDALVASRPLLPAERERAEANDVDYEHSEIPTAVAALRHPTSTWIDCLPTASLAETWASDGVVETWAEADVDAGSDDASRTHDGDARGGPPSDGAAIVRGHRAYQYAEGYGGLGYYEPADDWLVDAPGADDDSHTPLVRLAYLYIDGDALDRPGVASFVGAFARQSADEVGEVSYAAGATGR